MTHCSTVEKGKAASESRLEILDEIYNLYEAFSRQRTMACKKGCALCCTQDVTMTTLEGHRIIQHIRQNGRQDLIQLVRTPSVSKRYRPTMTTNAFARLCFKGKYPHEEHAYCQAACMFLSNNECLIYDARPFGCRCFFSTLVCGKEASAVVDPFLITVNMVFLQIIEHVDTGGFFGNMHDILACTADSGLNKPFWDPERGSSVCRNTPTPGFLLPPEHRNRMEPILSGLKKIVSVFDGN